MLKVAVLACILLLVDGARIVKRRGSSRGGRLKANRSQETIAVNRTGSVGDSIGDVLKALGGKSAQNITSDLLDGIAEIDFRKDIREEVKKVAKTQALDYVQSILTGVDPILGVVFSVFSTFFGWGGADENAELLEEVDKMIKGSLRDFNRDLIQRELNGFLNQIDYASENPKLWETFTKDAADKFTKVFGDCWSGSRPALCKEYRKFGYGGGAASLLLEVQLTNVMIIVALEIVKYDANIPISGLVRDTERASYLSKEHFIAFSKVRSTFSSQDQTGFIRGSVKCPGLIDRSGKNGVIRCGTTPSTDLLLERGFCGTRERKYATPSRPAFKRLKASLEANLTKCIKNYGREISQELSGLERQILSARKAAIKLKKVFGS